MVTQLYTLTHLHLKFMKSLLLLFFATLCSFALLHAQVTCEPAFPSVDDNVTITYDAAQGNAALTGINPVYVHVGLITNQSTSSSDWKLVATTWGTANAASTMTNAGTNLWTKTFNIRTFFNVPANVTVLKLAFVFRNGNGSIVGRATDGADIFYDVYPANGPLQTRWVLPTAPSLLLKTGDKIPLSAAASKSGDLTFYDNAYRWRHRAASGKFYCGGGCGARHGFLCIHCPRKSFTTKPACRNRIGHQLPEQHQRPTVALRPRQTSRVCHW
jgi:hypothetical protein